MLKRFLNPRPLMEAVAAPPCIVHIAEAELSHEEIHNALTAALRTNRPAQTYYYCREIYDEFVIYQEETPAGDALFKRPYVINDDGSVTLGEPTKVRAETSYVPLSEALRGGALLEALDGDGWCWAVQLIRAGVSANGNEYPLAVLHEAAPAYAGVPVYYGRGRDHNPHERGFDAVAGYITEAAANAHGVAGVFEVNRGKPDVRAAVAHAWDVQTRTGKPVMGFSHVVPTGGAVVEARKPRGYAVRKISRVESVDLVMSPAAGGALLSPLAESLDSLVPDVLQEAIVNLDQLLGRYRAGERLTEAEWRFVQGALEPAQFAALLAEAVGPTAVGAPAAATQTPAPATREAVAEPATNVVQLDEATVQRIAALERQTQIGDCRALLTRRLAEARLPQVLATNIAADFDGRVFESAELEARIERDRAAAAQLAAVRPHGVGAVELTADQRDKHAAAMDAFFGMPNQQGIRAFRSIKEAYQQIEGERRFSYIDEGLARLILREASGVAPADMRLEESIDSSTFAQLWGDSITRRLLREYQSPMYGSWRQIVTDILPVNDFRTQRRMRMGGYGDLPAVSQGAPYQPLTSPGDEEATYAISKRGGTEDLTLEAIANDDVGAIRRIPVALGRAAARTLYKAVWIDTIVGNVTCTYDSVALYHASHGNTGTNALSAANLLAAENAMRDQTAYGESNLVLGMANMPKILVIPNELRDTAFRLTQSSVAVGATNNAATEPNIFVGNGYIIIVVDELTDANDWFLFADPQNVPILEVGFFNGREDPELFVQDAPTVGSVFSADKVTYKIRHIWGIGVLDHRGTYRNVAA